MLVTHIFLIDNEETHDHHKEGYDNTDDRMVLKSMYKRK